MNLNPAFKIGEMVYILTDTDQNPRIVTGYTIRNNNQIFYLVSLVATEYEFNDFELSTDKTFR